MGYIGAMVNIHRSLHMLLSADSTNTEGHYFELECGCIAQDIPLSKIQMAISTACHSNMELSDSRIVLSASWQVVY